MTSQSPDVVITSSQPRTFGDDLIGWFLRVTNRTAAQQQVNAIAICTA